MNRANSKSQNNHIHQSSVGKMYGAMSEGKSRPSIEAIRKFRTTPTCYYSGKTCKHKEDKPCNPSCLLWADCQYGKEHKDGYIEELEAEIEQYRAIGTPEECRAAVEKQKAKEPYKDD